MWRANRAWSGASTNSRGLWEAQVCSDCSAMRGSFSQSCLSDTRAVVGCWGQSSLFLQMVFRVHRGPRAAAFPAPRRPEQSQRNPGAGHATRVPSRRCLMCERSNFRREVVHLRFSVKCSPALLYSVFNTPFVGRATPNSCSPSCLSTVT